ncbi:recombinase family protein [Paenisporosarcina sp. TG-14]|uniref:recombinase family protein n=1 Tax=Paenisporosarcina sp. TG-14 TaxID=1231057 RepID=UPI0012DFC757|nr:recombinase family protein [Paenisporosarcina sp. TG-14]
MLFGYTRVSTGLQKLDLQADALTQYGCVKIFHDKMSGSKKQRPGLKQALQYARQGDTIVIWRLDRLGRNMQELIYLVNNLNVQSIGFHSLQENLTMDRSNATGQLMFHLFAAFAEFERNLIQERSAAGRVAAKGRGRLGSRPEKYGEKDVEMMKALIDGGTPIKDVAERWGVSRTTIYRYLERK